MTVRHRVYRASVSSNVMDFFLSLELKIVVS